MYHQVTIIGNLGRDPDLKVLQSGTAVCNMSLASNEKWTDNGGESHTRTTWWRVSAWGKLGENCNRYLSKGRQVFVQGRMQPDLETGGPRMFTRNDGSAGSSYEVRADRVQFLGGRGDVQNTDDENFGEEPVEQDEIPF